MSTVVAHKGLEQRERDWQGNQQTSLLLETSSISTFSSFTRMRQIWNPRPSILVPRAQVAPIVNWGFSRSVRSSERVPSRLYTAQGEVGTERGSWEGRKRSSPAPLTRPLYRVLYKDDESGRVPVPLPVGSSAGLLSLKTFEPGFERGVGGTLSHGLSEGFGFRDFLAWKWHRLKQFRSEIGHFFTLPFCLQGT